MTDVSNSNLTVVEFAGGNLNDIPRLLENLAQEIRDGWHGDIVAGAAVLLRDDGDVIVFGWGKTEGIHSLGLLHLGAQWLATNMVERA